jgi:hypothetical protein
MTTSDEALVAECEARIKDVTVPFVDPPERDRVRRPSRAYFMLSSESDKSS